MTHPNRTLRIQTNTLTIETVDRLQGVGHRARDRRHEPGGAKLLAVHPGPPTDEELVTPDVRTGRVFRSSPGSGYRGLADEVDPTGSIRAQGRAIGDAYRRAFGTYSALGEGLASGFRGEDEEIDR